MCPEQVGVHADRTDSGFFECGLWGDVLIMLNVGFGKVLQIPEIRAYSWDLLSAEADPDKLTSSCGPDHCINTSHPILNGLQLSPAKLLIRRPISVYLKPPTTSGFGALSVYNTKTFFAWFRVELKHVSYVEAITAIAFK